MFPEAHRWERTPGWPHDKIVCKKCGLSMRVPKGLTIETFFQDLANSSNPPPECAVFAVHNS